MALTLKYDTQEAIPEGLGDHYAKQDDGSYALDTIEGLVAKDRLNEFRDNNIGLRKEVETAEKAEADRIAEVNKLKAQMDELSAKYSGIDLDEYTQQLADAKALKEKEMIEKGDVDVLIEQRVAEVLAAKQKEIDAIKADADSNTTNFDTTRTRLETQLNTLVVDNELSRFAAEKGVRSTAMEDVLARGRQIFKVEDGKAVAFEGDRKLFNSDAVTPLSMGDWLGGLAETAPHLFETSTGSGVNATNTVAATEDTITNQRDNLTSQEKILAGLAKI